MNLRKIGVSIGLIIGLFFITKLIMGGISSSKEKPKPKVTVVSDPLVKTSLVINKEVLPQYTTEGKLTSGEQISVSLEGKGNLQSAIELKEGSLFKKGQKIAYVIDNQSLSAYKASISKFDQLLSTVLVDINFEYPESIVKWKGYVQKVKSGTLPDLPNESNERLTNFLSSKGVFNAYHDLKALQSTLSKRNFIAPYDGYIVSVVLQAGSFVNGTSKVCEISPIGKKEVEFAVDERFENQIKIGLSVFVEGKTAKIIRVGQRLNSVTQQKQFVAQLLGEADKLLVGDFVTIKVPLSTQKVKAMKIPAFCVQEDVMFGVKSNLVLESKKLKIIGVSNDSLYVQGLNDKEIVLFEAYSNFKEGQKVRPNN
jgi:membrane fusion protein, multidrug efflux system